MTGHPNRDPGLHRISWVTESIWHPQPRYPAPSSLWLGGPLLFLSAPHGRRGRGHARRGRGAPPKGRGFPLNRLRPALPRCVAHAMASGAGSRALCAACSLRSPRRLLSTAAAAPQEQRGGAAPPPAPPRGSARSGGDPRGGARVPPPAVHFGDPREAFRSKSSAELVRGMVVLGLCALEPLVQWNRQLMNISRKLLGQQLFEKLMKMTFYGQFVAGEDQKAIKPLVQRNSALGVGSVLDYSVEEDLMPEERKKMDSCTSVSEKETVGAKQREKPYRVHRGSGDRHYFYADEAKCDLHMDTFLRCIEASGGSSQDGFSAIKLTALGRPQFLLQFSEVLMKWKKFFHQMAAEQGKAGLAVLETKLEVMKLQETLANLGIATKAESHHWFTGENLGVSGTVDLLDWNSLIDFRTKLSKLLLVPNTKSGQVEPLLSRFTEEEELQMKRMLRRMDILAQRALELGVRLMVDAEQTYFQPAISRLTLEMQRKFNTEKAAVFNTYQCYLKEAYDNMTVDVELSRREGWCFGAKLVRGAYMEQERDRAAQLGYEDPINPTYEETSEMYHRCLDYVLEEIKRGRKANVMVASHNEDTVKFTLRRMAELGIHPSENSVYFGQLLGMSDQITFPLGQAGYPVYKYVPYGPVSKVLPYLSRRAQENRGFMKRAKQERDLLWSEFKRRLITGSLFYSPSH